MAKLIRRIDENDSILHRLDVDFFITSMVISYIDANSTSHFSLSTIHTRAHVFSTENVKYSKI